MIKGVLREELEYEIEVERRYLEIIYLFQRKRGSKMKAQLLGELCEVEIEGQPRKIPGLPLRKNPLELKELPDPVPSSRQILVKVSVCGVCHTELDEIEGRRLPTLPVIPGHEVVGRVEFRGKEVKRFKPGDRVGVAWIYASCSKCVFCKTGRENLCEDFRGTGCDADGGYAEYMVVEEDFAYKIPDRFTDSEAAPLLCAGAIGFRALNLTSIFNAEILGLFGFGASAHIVIQIARFKYPDSRIFVFTRSRDHQDLSIKLGANWAGSPDEHPPAKIHRAIDFTPIGETIPKALKVMEKGGKLVINAIRKRSPVQLDYTDHLWHEKEIKSVANITKKDVGDFLSLAAEIPIIPEVCEFPLEEANVVLSLLKRGKIQGAAVLKISP